MTYENIKSIILTILVITSALLTWSLWTYQPSLDVMEKSNTVEEVTIGAKKDISNIVQPEKIFYHHENDKHLGTIDNGEIVKTIKEISRWNFDEFKNITNEIKDLPSFIHEKGNAVISFPDSISMNLYKNVIQIRDKNVPNFDFDRIVINTKDAQKENGLVYFVSLDNQQVFKSHVPVSFVQNFKNEYYAMSESNPNYSSYFPYSGSNNRAIFLPAEKPKMASYTYLSTPLESEKFKNALFSDPSVVQKNYQTAIEEYTTSSSLLRVELDKNTISFVNFAHGNEGVFTANDSLKRSIDFINGHSGWTGNYRFAEMDELNHMVLFRLYDAKGYPVFSENMNISEIRQVWGQNEIKEYHRSNFSLGLRTETTEVTLSSSEAVIDYLEGMKGFEQERLQDVALGYKMTKDPQTRLVHLEPSWYYRYNNEWKNMSMDETGGINRGLE